MTPHDAVVVGGGLAGAALALELAHAGRDVILLEKSTAAHDKVCGEFLSREALHYLDRLGIDLPGLGAVPIGRVRLASAGRTSEAALPFPALSLSRRCLDETLLHAARQAGVHVVRGAAVESLHLRDDAWQAAVRDASAVQAQAAFLATGKHDLRGLPRPPGTHNGLVGFKMYFRLQPAQQAALGNAVELTLFPGGYAGMQPVEGNRANLCLLVRADRLRACGGNWAGLLQHMQTTAPHLAERLHGAHPLLTAPLAITSIPYGHLQRTSADGLWRVGDQAAVIPSFSGDGMSIALHSAALAARAYLQEETADSYQRQLARQLQARIVGATWLSRLLVDHPCAAAPAQWLPWMLPSIAFTTRIPDRFLQHGALAARA